VRSSCSIEVIAAGAARETAMVLEMCALAGQGELVRPHRTLTGDTAKARRLMAKGIVDADAHPSAGRRALFSFKVFQQGHTPNYGGLSAASTLQKFKLTHYPAVRRFDTPGPPPLLISPASVPREGAGASKGCLKGMRSGSARRPAGRNCPRNCERRVGPSECHWGGCVSVLPGRRWSGA